MRCAVIFYHKNIASIYKKEWIEECVDSIKNQTMEDFDVIELNYGGGEEKYAEGVRKNYIFLNREFENHIGAMNYLYSMLFANGYDVVFNTNMDDKYDMYRFVQQLNYLIGGKHGDDNNLVSSNWTYIDGDGKFLKSFKYNIINLAEELNKNHNIIAHPAVAMHKSFWDDDLHYNDLLGKEDLDLWQRALKKGKKMKVLVHFHLFYRIHDNQITKKYRK